MFIGCGVVLELVVGVSSVRGCLCICARLLSLLFDFVAVRLSPRCDGICRGVAVPVVPRLLVDVVTIGDVVLGVGVVMVEF